MRYLIRRCAWLGLSATLLATACSALPRNLPTPTPIPTPPADSGRQVYTVTRGTIEQQVKVLGRVSSAEEDTMYFRQDGRVFHIAVDTNQTVKKGDVLAELDTTDLTNQVKAAQIQFQIAQLKVDQAMGKGGSGSEPTAVLTARSALAKAESDYSTAQNTLDLLLEGPTTADVDAARAAVAKAENQLQQDQSNLVQLQTPPTPDQVTVAKATLDSAQAALAQAQAAYDLVKLRPNVAALPQSAALQQATTAFQAAQAAYNLATAPPKPSDIAVLQKSIQADQASVTAAKKNVAQVLLGATQADVNAARAAVSAAKSKVAVARSNLDQALGDAKGTSLAVQEAKKNETLAQLQLQGLQEQLDAAKLRAPFDGVVTEVDTQDGSQITAYAPILTLSNPNKLEISAVLQPSDLSQVALGQPATIVFNAYPTAKLQGKIISMPSIATGDSSQLSAALRTVDISFPKPPGPVNLEDLANVTIDVQRKDGVLLLPTVAIQTSGSNQFVQVLTPDGLHREVYIQVGISDDTNTEITAGLQAGTKVLAPTAANVASQVTPTGGSGGAGP